ncbi:MAG: N-acetylneuraminate synthase [Caldilineaceae bacterium]
MSTIAIGNRLIGPQEPCFLIAEAGVNHNGDIELARQLIDAATRAGADAVKFQTFKASRLVTPNAPKAKYQRAATNGSESQYEMLQRLELSLADHQELIRYCEQQGIIFLSTPFDEESADLLEELGVVAFKIPSGEISNHSYLAHIARKGKPLIISTGMSNLGEVEQAVTTVETAGNAQFTLLHCVSNYPADPADVNLRAMHTLQTAFGAMVGYSDHTLGLEVTLAAVALGAKVIEKHFTLDRTMPGPDHQASLEPDELAALVKGMRTVEMALGHGRKQPTASEKDTAQVARKSLVAAKDLAAHTQLTAEMIQIKRPGTGLPPAMREYLIGRTLKSDVAAGELLQWEMLA